METFERRSLVQPIELRGEKGSLVAAGYAIVYNKLSGNLGGFVERVMPGAADKTMQERDIRALYNHDIHKLLGRMSAGTLRLESDGTGVFYEIDLPDTTVGRDVAALLERGDITGSSFGFRTMEDEWGETDQGFPLRDLKQISVRDVGPVTFPAYPDATSALRSLAEARSMDVDEVIASAEANDLMTLLKRQSSEGAKEEEVKELFTRRRFA